MPTPLSELHTNITWDTLNYYPGQVVVGSPKIREKERSGMIQVVTTIPQKELGHVELLNQYITYLQKMTEIRVHFGIKSEGLAEQKIRLG